MKLTMFIFIFLFINNCSFNKDSKFWTEDVIKKEITQKKISKILKKSGDLTSLTAEEYAIYIDHYTKKSKYPDISQ